MLKEFRDFIVKGNALDLAIGVILAVASWSHSPRACSWPSWRRSSGSPTSTRSRSTSMETPIQYGRVLTAIINLILVGAVLFLVVKAVNRLRGPKVAPETDHDLLAQIRDELRSRRAGAT